MKVKLESDSKALADVVVIGYGTARKERPDWFCGYR